MKRLTQLFLKLGHVKTVLLITAFSVLVSVLVSAVTLFALKQFSIVDANVNFSYSVLMSVLVPLIVAPIVSWFLIGQMFRIHWLEQEMRTLATYDALTGLLNRKAFLDQAEFALNIARRDKQDCTIVIADIDFFKKINDQYGHAAGDRVLVMFGEVVRNMLRSSDLAGRIGGEEFAFCLPLTSKAEAKVFTDRLHDVVRRSTLHIAGVEVKITISIGQVSCPADVNHPVSTLLEFADIALYQAKNNGRNQTRTSSCA